MRIKLLPQIRESAAKMPQLISLLLVCMGGKVGDFGQIPMMGRKKALKNGLNMVLVPFFFTFSKTKIRLLWV